MRVHLLTLRYSSTLGAFDTAPLTALTHGCEVVAFREHFFQVADVPHALCVVTVHDPPPLAQGGHEARSRADHGAPSGLPRTRTPRESRDLRPFAALDEAQRQLFNRLREWRSATAKSEGVPPYVLLTNREAVRIILAAPDSLTTLGQLEGIGASKVTRYGHAILGCLQGAPVASAQAAEPTS